MKKQGVQGGGVGVWLGLKSRLTTCRPCTLNQPLSLAKPWTAHLSSEEITNAWCMLVVGLKEVTDVTFTSVCHPVSSH